MKTPIEISDSSGSDEPNLTLFKEMKSEIWEYLDHIKERVVGNVATLKLQKSFINPGLVVSDALIPLPLTPRDAEIIKKACGQAAPNQANETRADSSVRKSWELDPTQFKFTNPDWQEYATTLMNETAQALTMSHVRAVPSKLVLHEEGALFKNPKIVPGMVGKLIICLPSKHDGGSIHLSHAGKKYILDTDKACDFGLTSLAWYSDVANEAKPLKSGCRLAIIYNITQTKGDRFSAELVDKQSETLRSLFSKWAAIPDDQLPNEPQLMYVLAHRYTNSSFSLSNLRSWDRIVCQSLYEVGLDCGFTVLLANMTRIRYTEDENMGGEGRTILEDIRAYDGTLLCAECWIENDDNVSGYDCEDLTPDEKGDEIYPGYYTKRTYNDTVAVIVPMSRLSRFAFDDTYDRGVMKFFREALKDHASDERVRANLFKMLIDTIRSAEPNAEVLSDMLRIAIESQNNSLRHEVISGLLQDPKVQPAVLPIVAQFLKESSLKSPKQQPDWNYWFGDLVGRASTYPLTGFLEFTARFESILEAQNLKSSFQDWKGPATDKVVELTQQLNKTNYNFLVCLLSSRSGDMSWLRNWFTPVLVDKATKQLVCLILKAIYDKREASILPNATEMFRCILEKNTEKLALEIGDFPNNIQPALPYGARRQDETKRQDEPCLKDVIQVIEQGFAMKFTQQTTQLLEKSCTDIHQGCQKLKENEMPYVTSVRSFLQSILAILKKYQVRPLESVRDMFVTLLRKVMVANPPRLRSAPRLGSRGPSPLKIDFSAFDDRVMGLRCEYVESLLGEDLYRELVLLEGIQGRDEVKQAEKGAKRREVAMRKRAGSQLNNSPASRPKLMDGQSGLI
ncbi:uncharacterized protein F4822DRAFT_427240 [Hypoxylon trugodes]|uniref:uncharacterized protein n=1 Tax=Hypoxylon trugodes TaxID=326681 RepID=UPI00218F3F31|nr:uncharacterized protein F4822DRAFT_427240 [Hypoxylon trugodes]KAI1391391.1 hypothetical protein F4822DRAFT_427240 [Hypoxylon trugodes]